VAIFTTPAGSKQETNILPPTNTVGAYNPDAPAPAAETVEPTEPAVRYHLTDAERDVVERVVMAEAGGESFEGQMLVAQCILNAAEKRGVEPSEAVVLYSYTKSRPDPTQRVKDAVAAVFDRGETVVDEPILYFYNPALVTSDFHESQIFVIEEGGHRFFAERSTR
jgi:spore germination cell wall hydrolase CwlJ-like protein